MGFSGLAPGGGSVSVELGGDGRLLLGFLAARCNGCDEFWRGLRDRSSELSVELPYVIVTRSTTGDRQAIGRLYTGFRPGTVVMSDEAWRVFNVFSYPTFIVVDRGSSQVLGETIAFTWSDLERLLDTAG